MNLNNYFREVEYAVESFDLQTMKWTDEPDFPFTPVAWGRNVPYGQTFLSVGGHTGYNGGERADFIYRVRSRNSCTLMTT